MFPITEPLSFSRSDLVFKLSSGKVERQNKILKIGLILLAQLNWVPLQGVQPGSKRRLQKYERPLFPTYSFSLFLFAHVFPVWENRY